MLQKWSCHTGLEKVGLLSCKSLFLLSALLYELTLQCGCLFLIFKFVHHMKLWQKPKSSKTLVFLLHLFYMFRAVCFSMFVCSQLFVECNIYSVMLNVFPLLCRQHVWRRRVVMRRCSLRYFGVWAAGSTWASSTATLWPVTSC